MGSLNVTNVSTMQDVKTSQESHVHQDLFSRNLTLISITDFQFLINNDICNSSHIAQVILVHSAPQNKRARDIIRWTWGIPNIPNVMTKLVFLLGKPHTEKAQDIL